VKRRIIIPIDTIMELLKDYTRQEGSIPADAMPVSLLVKPSERGMFAIMAESSSWKDDTPVRVTFDIQRVVTV